MNETTQTLQAITAILAAINILVPNGAALIALVLDWFRAEHPDIPNSELIGTLRQHGLDNVAAIDAWIAAHP